MNPLHLYYVFFVGSKHYEIERVIQITQSDASKILDALADFIALYTFGLNTYPAQLSLL